MAGCRRRVREIANCRQMSLYVIRRAALTETTSCILWLIIIKTYIITLCDSLYIIIYYYFNLLHTHSTHTHTHCKHKAQDTHAHNVVFYTHSLFIFYKQFFVCIYIYIQDVYLFIILQYFSCCSRSETRRLFLSFVFFFYISHLLTSRARKTF